MDSNHKTETSDDDAAEEASKKEPGIEFLKGVTVSNVSPRTSTQLNLLPSIHSTIHATRAPFFNSYRSMIQGWKNSVPKLYKYSPSDIEVVVYRKNGQIDKLKTIAGNSESSRKSSIENTREASQAVVNGLEATTLFCKGDSGTPPEFATSTESAESRPTTPLEQFQEVHDEANIKTSTSFGMEHEECANELVGSDAFSLEPSNDLNVLQTLLDEELHASTVIPAKHGVLSVDKSKSEIIPHETSTKKREPEVQEGFRSSPRKSEEILTNLNMKDKAGSSHFGAAIPNDDLSRDRCHLKLLGPNHDDSFYKELLDVGVSKALLDVATQATAQIVGTLEAAIQNVPSSRNGSTQTTEKHLASKNVGVQSNVVEKDTKCTETDSVPSKIVFDFGCQKLPLVSTNGCQTESPKVTSSSCQSFLALISEETQTQPSICVSNASSQTYISQCSSTNQTDPDILNSAKSSQACQTMVETQNAECQVDAVEKYDLGIQCKPEVESKGIQLTGACCRLTEKRIKLKYGTKLRQLLNTVSTNEKKKNDVGGQSSTSANGGPRILPPDATASISDSEGEYTIAMVRELIATFKERQRETDELHEQLKSMIELLTEEISYARSSLDSHEYIEDNWYQDNTPSA